jgi:hypothetical protein
MKKYVLILPFLLLLQTNSFSQSRLKVDLRTRICGIGLLGNLNDNGKAFSKEYPAPRFLGGRPYAKFRLRNFSVGPETDFVFPNSFFGFVAGVKLINKSYYLPPNQQYNNGSRYITMSATGIAPLAGFTFKFGNFESKKRPFINITGRYDHYYKYKEREEIKGYFKKSPVISRDIQKISNNGYSALIALGVTNDAGGSWSIEIERPLYNFFNKNYVTAQGTQPYSAYKTNIALVNFVYVRRLRISEE